MQTHHSKNMDSGHNHLRFQPGAPWLDTNRNHINAHGGGILFHNGVYWWYGEHKTAGSDGNRAQVGVHVYSSEDFLSWKDEGIALPVSTDLESDIVQNCIIERPKVVYNPSTRKFVMWFHLERLGCGYTSALSGVAVADHPAGPFRYIESFRPNQGVWPSNVPEDLKIPLTEAERLLLAGTNFSGAAIDDYPKELIYRRDFGGGQMARDMTLFVDDDGEAYHIYASEENGTLHISLLTDDWLKPVGKYVRVMPGRFHEAPAMMKHEGRYFLFTSGCTGWNPNAARLLWAPSIWGPWEELGNPCVGTPEQKATTFQSQSTFVLPIAERPGAFIFMADRWNPANPIDGRYVWLPIFYKDGQPEVAWRDSWGFGIFDTL